MLNTSGFSLSEWHFLWAQNGWTLLSLVVFVTHQTDGFHSPWPTLPAIFHEVQVTGEKAKQGSMRECVLGPPAPPVTGHGPHIRKTASQCPHICLTPSQTQTLTYALIKLCTCLKNNNGAGVHHLAYAADSVLPESLIIYLILETRVLYKVPVSSMKIIFFFLSFSFFFGMQSSLYGGLKRKSWICSLTYNFCI